MKLRIQDNSVRFRITIRELERLGEEGAIVSETLVPVAGAATAATRFCYEVRRVAGAPESSLEVTGLGFCLSLGDADFAQLASDENEGAYIRREWLDGDGALRRFLVFIEKDRPGAACEKPEAWVYEQVPGEAAVTRDIPRRRELEKS